MPRILITGANSFIGKNFIQHSKFTSIDEVCLVKNSPANIDFSKYDVVLHLAAIVHQSKKIAEETYFSINRDLPVEVAKQAKAKGVQQFIFLSSIKVYGEYPKSGIAFTETSPCLPNDAYGKSKLAAEKGLLALNSPEFMVSIIRPPLIYGPGVKANMKNIVRLVDKFPVLPLGKIENKRSMCSVQNLIQLIDCVADRKKSGVFLASDREPISTTDLCRIIAKHLNKNCLLVSLPTFMRQLLKHMSPGHFERLFGSLEVNNNFTQEELDFDPQLSTDQGIEKMVDHYLVQKRNRI